MKQTLQKIKLNNFIFMYEVKKLLYIPIIGTRKERNGDLLLVPTFHYMRKTLYKLIYIV